VCQQSAAVSLAQASGRKESPSFANHGQQFAAIHRDGLTVAKFCKDGTFVSSFEAAQDVF
jgi:hypothetical protein